LETPVDREVMFVMPKGLPEFALNPIVEDLETDGMI
jgi:hypothetical protein